jgi:hypothetical protein
MRIDGGNRFDVYLGTTTAVLMLVREVSWRTAHVIAHHHADTRGQPVFIRNCATRAEEIISPRA